jgi:hypothetical protein
MVSLVDHLKERVDRLADLIAVHETIAAYGPTIDGGSPLWGGSLWTDDCVYDSDGAAAGANQTRAGIESLIEGARMATIGFGHITHLPVVVIDGDRATAYAASELPVAPDGNEFQISRVSANRWDLRRGEGRWQIERRTSRLLDGSQVGKEIFAEGARSATEERAARALDRSGSNSTEEYDMGISEELAAIDNRISALEDKLAIMQVVAGYGPSMDGGADTEAGSLWTEDSWYDADASPAAAEPHGRAGIEGAARSCLEDPVGFAHISHMPLIKVEGDKATVVNHSNTFQQDGDGFRIGRVSSNRWELVRVDGTWQIERRINRLLNGSKESRAVFAEGVQEILGT